MMTEDGGKCVLPPYWRGIRVQLHHLSIPLYFTIIEGLDYPECDHHPDFKESSPEHDDPLTPTSEDPYHQEVEANEDNIEYTGEAQSNDDEFACDNQGNDTSYEQLDNDYNHEEDDDDKQYDLHDNYTYDWYYGDD